MLLLNQTSFQSVKWSVKWPSSTGEREEEATSSFAEIDEHQKKEKPRTWQSEFDRPIYFAELRGKVEASIPSALTISLTSANCCIPTRAVVQFVISHDN
jgi:hypothetical protein